jgi:hypothetical protein
LNGGCSTSTFIAKSPFIEDDVLPTAMITSLAEVSLFIQLVWNRPTYPLALPDARHRGASQLERILTYGTISVVTSTTRRSPGGTLAE